MAAAVAGRSMLVFGGTGQTGRRVVEHALRREWHVTMLSRNPDNVPEAVRGRVTVVKGDLNDAAAVSAVVKSSRPDAIVECSSFLPFNKGPVKNNANRTVIVHAVCDALQAEGRLASCNFVIVGGAAVPEPGGTTPSVGFMLLSGLIRTASWLFAPKVLAEMDAMLKWLFVESPPELRFAMLRLAFVDEAPSRGTLVAETSVGGSQRSSLTWIDLGAGLVELAADLGPWNRKAFYFNYGK